MVTIIVKQAIGLVTSKFKLNARMHLSPQKVALFLGLFLGMLPIFLSATTANCLNDNEQPRVNVVLFQYAGTEHGEKAKNFFSRFQAMLKRQLETIPTDIAYRNIGSVDLATLSIFFAGPDKIAHLADRTSYASRPGILEMLRGDVREVDNHFEVISYIFLGDRKGKLTYPEIEVSMPIHTGAYANTRDGFKLIATYALAVDAHFRQCPTALVEALLGLANNNISNIRARSGNIEAVFNDIELAIRSLEQELSQ